ncbi:tyrosine-protein phosphatase [Pseudarthrobacter sp. PS3-L1]|uniref:tyrosine-protein phosphatase n=1 Tax=Pseudarthrobacter sp. PS3-L1 TaxID=3046207 RepID=UPI0024BBE173|nr:tyrosine-protein phosphatase [Pseudarthrobacter sp. PS3-L1]MDJ0319307.1 tyrosine-protein phosphatase [Pseudarthrobacter sp. PS3-L1]
MPAATEPGSGNVPLPADSPEWDGAVNAWRVKGRIFRMGRREWLTAQGWQQAYEDGVRTVIDLRNPDETGRRSTDPDVADVVLAKFNILSVPTEEGGNAEFDRLCVPYLNHPALYPDNARIFPQRLVAVFRAIAEARGAVVFHCAAGRDRSGMIGAMLQDLAGDSDAQIVAGYQRSMRRINERYGTHGVPHSHERHLTEIELAAELRARGTAVLEFVRALGTSDFLRRNGLSEEELHQIDRLIQPLPSEETEGP